MQHPACCSALRALRRDGHDASSRVSSVLSGRRLRAAMARSTALTEQSPSTVAPSAFFTARAFSLPQPLSAVQFAIRAWVGR